MKRFFSGNRSNESESELYMSSPTTYRGISDSSIGTTSFGREEEPLSSELVPIVTLLTAHTHRRYHEGILMILHDLKNDGSPAVRKWKEVYGVLIGTQVAFWDTKELVDTNEIDFRKFASKPTYLNLNDAILKPVDAVEGISTASNKKLENALIISTTLKNRYFLQFNDKPSFNKWNAAIHLSIYENVALQEGYTGAFLSSRGARLSDIKIILASTKYDYEDWVSVRFGTGMPWRRCYAVITQQGSKKSPCGQIKFYENEKKTKKADTMAVITSASEVYAVYPSAAKLIDTSTIIKVEGTITFEKIDNPTSTNIFIMPEKHMAVQGYDTIIRFLIPAMNAFQLYGRPKRLIANKDDPESLLFGLPTLPHIYYLQVDDILKLATSTESLRWSNADWKQRINEIMLIKNRSGYSGCGTSKDLKSSINSSFLESGELFDAAGTILSPKLNAKSSSTSPKSDRIAKSSSTSSSASSSVFPGASTKQAISMESPERQYMKSPERINTQSDSITVSKRMDRNNRSNDSLNNIHSPTSFQNVTTNRNGYAISSSNRDNMNNRSPEKRKGHIPEQSTESISSIFNMYDNNDVEEESSNSMPLKTESSKNSKSDIYNSFVQMGGRNIKPDNFRVSSEIEKLGTGIKNISMNKPNATNTATNTNTNSRNSPTRRQPYPTAMIDDPDPFDPSFMEQDRMVEYDNELNSRSVASSIHEKNLGYNSLRNSPSKSYISATSSTSDHGSKNSGNSKSDVYHSAIDVNNSKMNDPLVIKPKYNPFAKENNPSNNPSNNDNDKRQDKYQQLKNNSLTRTSPERLSISPNKMSPRRENNLQSNDSNRQSITSNEKFQRRKPPVAEELLQPVQGSNNESRQHSNTSSNYSNNNPNVNNGKENINRDNNGVTTRNIGDKNERSQQYPNPYQQNVNNNPAYNQNYVPQQTHFNNNGNNNAGMIRKNNNMHNTQGYAQPQLQGYNPQQQQSQQYSYPQTQQYGYSQQQQMYMQQQNRFNQGYDQRNPNFNSQGYNTNQNFPPSQGNMNQGYSNYGYTNERYSNQKHPRNNYPR
ncbi:similar to Saccharomyces cerevisiae YNL278W CAF120 Part of the evolutionarily-conserved CCR4-NOT transcriptional regulatory complex involved in controlling mRNA initiation [Maudiozyma barnettii]|uniref:Similar to Saccharomyces cerevisiae YNL278W CAF120 Part of the evolutionarily-conserved CCR4-NOT transcriptional regulatory complex involved in controlling mRNA initiation n=1 Tax=Maudiozyma barnettii TaxID=61262 RepID=A0A8H2ZFX4_9SACH|nr:Caf120p [Kazachstania barnettii]CAB4253944.1 similar to Saccharomyces cerevisiae YNL278W CAF120 Part of the evolutionarily-conserved CCR4-NOT transcriptional regulatory complex involved in controlling mRNA initiation [Kazachstania barnettii]CAD1781694.1 similar to Saccharomyces cerevisiae YNL278W CAF120 Part of the evolutionarily-conserved CCR4-NOT transcriptional regulatory complex involved in controlling mRNA initiation [Kazachstania barnettii]